ncbi:luciferin 4-monooxygenase-like [Haemaphysalis longicornis]
MHVSGLWLLFSYLAQGCHVILVRSTDISALLSAAEKYHATSISLHPAAAVQVSPHPLLLNGRLKTVRKVITGGGTVQAPVLITIAEKLGTGGVARAYGMTETLGGICISPPTLEDFRKIGKPLAFMQMKVVDTDTRQTLGPHAVGEICVKGAMVFKGYQGRPEDTAATMHDGFLLTGDMGYYDSKGSFFVTGRLKDLIKCMDQQVIPAELEYILAGDPAVRHVVVVGVPHPAFREAARAFVVLKKPLPSTDRETFMKSEAARLGSLVEKLSHHKHLHGGIEFVDSIPETGTGKELRRVLREAYLRRLDASQK